MFEMMVGNLGLKEASNWRFTALDTFRSLDCLDSIDKHFSISSVKRMSLTTANSISYILMGAGSGMSKTYENSFDMSSLK